MALIKHRERAEMLPRFGDFMSLLPPWSLFEDTFRDIDGKQLIRVEEFRDGDDLIVRAEMPGIDPDRDVEITASGGMLHITAERTEEQEKKEKAFHRRELRYGSFARTIALPEGIDAATIGATYTDGILEVRIPVPAVETKESTERIAVTRG